MEAATTNAVYEFQLTGMFRGGEKPEPVFTGRWNRGTPSQIQTARCEFVANWGGRWTAIRIRDPKTGEEINYHTMIDEARREMAWAE